MNSSELEFEQNKINLINALNKYLWITKSAAFYLIFINTVGFLGNFLVVFVTFRSKNLTSTCNFLLVLICIGNAGHQLGVFVAINLVLRNIYFIPMKQCLNWQTLPLLGFVLGETLPLLIGIDRMLCYFWPLLHRSFNKKLYLLVNLLICLFYYAFIIIPSYRLIHPNDAVNCLVIDAMPPSIILPHFTACATFNISALILYIIIWINLKAKRGNSENMNRIFKSLATIILNIFFGWFLMAVMRAMLITFQADAAILFCAKWVAACIVNTTCSLNPIVLFCFSRDYAEALRKELERLNQKMQTSVHHNTSAMFN